MTHVTHGHGHALARCPPRRTPSSKALIPNPCGAWKRLNSSGLHSGLLHAQTAPVLATAARAAPGDGLDEVLVVLEPEPEPEPTLALALALTLTRSGWCWTPT